MHGVWEFEMSSPEEAVLAKRFNNESKPGRGSKVQILTKWKCITVDIKGNSKGVRRNYIFCMRNSSRYVCATPEFDFV